MYPQFPEPTISKTHRGELPKLALDVLMDIYDEFSQLGLYLVPKRRDKKFPVSRFWEKKGGQLAHILADRTEALNWQRQDTVSGWCVVTGEQSNRVVVVDFDTAEIEHNGMDVHALYNTVQKMSPTSFVLKSPANGVHLYYRLPDEFPMLGNDSPPVNGVDLRGEGGQVVTIGGFNRYDNTNGDAYADKKGVPDGHCATYTKIDSGEYHCIPYMSESLYAWLTSKKQSPDVDLQEARNYGLTEVGQARLEEHFKHNLDERERLIIECLGYVLDSWNEDKTYDQWLSMWMSAHHGSSGSPRVRDYILTYPTIYWKHGEEGRSHFRHAWDTYVWREGGITVATLMWLAKLAGWLTRTGYEIPDELCEIINYPYVSNWVDSLDVIPDRLLLISQTGTGKTFTIRRLYDNLGQPKTVIFVPSIKLATELAMTLRTVHKMDVVLYRDNETGRTLSSDELSQAHVLVTTLQTFSNKVNNPMSDYGLVYVEESDQLLAQFARGGGGIYGSHVSEKEARGGFRVIREAMQESGKVWFVDATMTSITYSVAEATRTDRSIQIVRNAYMKPKAKVEFVPSKGIAYQTVLRALERGKRVVVACDTAVIAEEIVQTMETIGALDDKKHLLIIRRTERNPEVTAFMENVNAHAGQYDLIVHNSVMASGVSITDTMPDLVVQICTYLTPRINLQMLNRYRRQKQVVCYYRTGENLYADRAIEILEYAKTRAMLESQLINIPLAIRSSDAELRAYAASLSVGDNETQERSPREFYMALLRGDGREVVFTEGTPVSDIVKHSLKGVQEIRKAQKELVSDTWHTVEPIDRDRPALPEYTDMQVVLGEVHAEIQRALRGNIPDLNRHTPREVFDIVQEFRHVGFILTAFIRQEEALRRAEQYMADRGKAITTLMNNVTLIKILSLLHYLYHNLDDVLTPDLLDERAKEFLYHLTEQKEAYNAVVPRKSQKFDEIYARNKSVEKRAVSFAKILLARLGLKQRSFRATRKDGEAVYHYHIANIENAQKFLKWRNEDDTTFIPDIVFTTEPIDDIILSRTHALSVFKDMDEGTQDTVMDLLDETDFVTAVQIVTTGSGF